MPDATIDLGGAMELDLQLLDAATHRRILDFLNRATHPDDLASAPDALPRVASPTGDLLPPQGPVEPLDDGPLVLEPLDDLQRIDGLDLDAVDWSLDWQAEIVEPTEVVISSDLAERILDLRNRRHPIGFTHLDQLREVDGFESLHERILFNTFGPALFGRWSTFPQTIPRRGTVDPAPSGSQIDGIIHAALLHTGEVLFITSDETTRLWNPTDPSTSSFSEPKNQPHKMPGGYSQLCGHHSFLSNGQMLSVGGGGYAHIPGVPRWGFRYDPIARTWTRTAGPMSESRWYPTAVTLGDRRVLVVCGHGHGDMDVYDEATDQFRRVRLREKAFPYLYPGLHLLPDDLIFYSRTGWGSAGPNGGPFNAADDDQSAYFRIQKNAGIWSDIGKAPPTIADRTKGMSVLLLDRTGKRPRVLVFGGADPTNSDTFETIDVGNLSSASNWSTPLRFPDKQRRSLASGVLLPDGSVFICGGIQKKNSPCTLFDPSNSTWQAMAELPSIRDYHSAALLLPSGQVMMAGWRDKKIEIFEPPYLFRGTRPTITSASSLAYYGQQFAAWSPDAGSITRMVLVRPMAVTHQTDSEQRVIELRFARDLNDAQRLHVSAPDEDDLHSLAPEGYYMLFAIDKNGVPSVAHWICLSSAQLLTCPMNRGVCDPPDFRPAIRSAGGLYSTTTTYAIVIDDCPTAKIQSITAQVTDGLSNTVQVPVSSIHAAGSTKAKEVDGRRWLVLPKWSKSDDPREAHVETMSDRGLGIEPGAREWRVAVTLKLSDGSTGQLNYRLWVAN